MALVPLSCLAIINYIHVTTTWTERIHSSFQEPPFISTSYPGLISLHSLLLPGPCKQGCLRSQLTVCHGSLFWSLSLHPNRNPSAIWCFLSPTAQHTVGAQIGPENSQVTSVSSFIIPGMDELDGMDGTVAWIRNGEIRDQGRKRE